MKLNCQILAYSMTMIILLQMPLMEELKADTLEVVIPDSIHLAVELTDTLRIDTLVTDTLGVDTVASTKSNIPLVDALQSTQPSVELTVTFGKIFWSIVIFILGWLVVKLITKILETMSERWTNLRLTVKRVIPIFRIGAIVFTIYIVIAWVINPPMQTFFAVLASAGIAIGFASQDILKNIFGGIMILFDRPFQVGDKIQVGNHYGEVISIGLRSVRITTPDDSMVSIPNSEIVNQSVSNSNSGESNCQVVSEIYLPLGIDTNLVRDIAIKCAATSRYAYLKKPIVANFRNEMHQSRPMLKMRLKAYVLDIRYEFNFASDMTESTLKALLDKKLIKSSDYQMNNVPESDE